MKTRAKQFLFALAAFLMLGSLRAELQISAEASPFLKGVSDNLEVKFYVTGDLDITTLTATFTVPENTIDALDYDEFNNDVISDEADQSSEYEADAITFTIQGKSGSVSIEQPAQKTLVYTAYLNVEDDFAGSEIPFTLDYANAPCLNGSKKVTYKSTNGTITSDGCVAKISQAFNFALTGTAIATAEDNAITLNAADKTYFSCTAGTELPLQVTGKVAFDSDAMLLEGEGDIEVEDGKIVFTPAENWNGSAVIAVTAISTDDAIEGEVACEIPVTVNPVDDDPVITLDDASLTEGETFTLTFSFSDVDNDWADYDTPVVKGFNDDNIAGNWTFDNDQLVFTSQNAIPYTFVKHPAKSAAANLDIAFSKNGKIYRCDTTQGDDPATLPVADVDRAVTTAADATVTILPAKTGDTLSYVLSANAASDEDDEDTVEYTAKWTCDSVEKAQPADVQKGQTWSVTVTPWTQVYDGEDPVAAEAIVSADIVIGNTAPVLNGDETAFIQMPDEGKPAPKTLSYTITDPDAIDAFEAASVTISGYDASKGTPAVTVFDGKSFTVTYTVADGAGEFFGDDADSFQVKVSDGDDDSNVINVTVTYRKDPPPAIVETVPAEDSLTADEVDAEGKDTVLTFALTAADSALVTPSGVASIAWNLALLDGKTDITDFAKFLTIGAFTPSTGTAAATATATVTLNRDVISGADRSKVISLVLSAVATDGNGAAAEPKVWTITVNDSDRAPTTPTIISLSKEEIYAGDDLTAEAAGAQDADGDAISYVYTFTLNGENESENLTGIIPYDNIRKGDEIAISVKAQSTPEYAEAPVFSEDSISTTIIVKNTAPTADKVADIEESDQCDEYVKADETSEQTFAIAVENLVTFSDVDADKDELTITVDYAGIAAYAEKAEIVDNETLVLTLKPGANTSKAGTLPSVKLIATDRDGETAEADVLVTINQINDKPVIEAPETVVLSEEDAAEGFTGTFTIKAGSDEALTFDENEQEISDVELKSDNDALEVKLEDIENANGIATITYSVKLTAPETIEPGTPIVITVNALDDGDPSENAEETEFTVIVGGTWYPEYISQCTDTDIDGLLIEALDENGDLVASFVCTSTDDEHFVMAASDYFDAGFYGFEPGTYTFNEYHWSVTTGKGRLCSEDNTVNVSNYGKPGTPDLSYDDGQLSVSIPLAQGYTFTVYDEDGKIVTKGGRYFLPDEEGDIPTTDTIDLVLPEGAYTVLCRGFNPLYYSEEASFDIFCETEASFSDPWEGTFYPANNSTLNTADNTLIVTFTWPSFAAASSYIFQLFNTDGSLIEEYETSYCSCPPACLDTGNYTWRVIASDGIQSKASPYFSLTIINTTHGQITLTGAYVNQDNKLVIAATDLIAGRTYTMDLVWFNDNDGVWYMETVSATAVTSDEGIPALVFNQIPAVEGYYVLCRPEGANDFSTFQIETIY